MIGWLAAAAVAAGIAVFATGSSEPAALARLDGVWRSRGYGWIWSVDDGDITAYDYTASFCTRRSRNDLANDLGSRIHPGEDRKSFRIALDDPSYFIVFDRIDELPDECTDDPETDPETVFRTAAEIFSQHYAFFRSRNIDWPSLVARYDDEVTPDTDDEELFEILTKLIAPIDDAHVGLEGEVDGSSKSFEPEAKPRRASAFARVREGEIRYWTRGVASNLAAGGLRNAGGKDVRYGLVGKDVGYIQISSIGSDLQDAAEGGMIDARELFKNARALIIDLSGNSGGYDVIAREFASLFAAQRTVSYYKYPDDARGEPPQQIHIEPGKKPLFTGPVFLITDQETVSAAEILTMCLRALPNVTHVGEATRGSLSDILEKKLPNGWTVNLSNEVYLDSERQAWEGRGIPPNIEFAVHSEDSAPGDPEEAARRMIEYLLREVRKS